MVLPEVAEEGMLGAAEGHRILATIDGFRELAQRGGFGW